MIGRAASRTFTKLKRGLHSTTTWIVLIVLALIGTGIAIRERGRGHLTKLKSELAGPAPVEPGPTPQPGGQNAIVLTRMQQAGGITPEFLSATLLPGRGMNVLQITAYLPGKGEVPLLVSPPLEVAAKAMTGIDSDVNGEASLAIGGAFEVPWAGQISGTALQGGTSVPANWEGRVLALPINAVSSKTDGLQSSAGGLMLKLGASSSGTDAMPDGGLAQATFTTGNFGGHWPSKTEVKTTVLLSARTMDLTVVAKNVGTEPEPMGIGWRPRFAIPSGDRSQVMIKLPSTTRIETSSEASGLPTGRLLPTGKTAYDFSQNKGAALKSMSLNDTFVHLQGGMLSSGPEVELRDPVAGYGLHMTMLSASIKAIRVYAPANKAMVSIDPQSNYGDPFGREWSKDEDTGLVVLHPGESMQWKIRLELFQPSTSTSGQPIGQP